MGLGEQKLKKVLNAYQKGKEEFTLNGKKYFIKNLREFKIFTHEHQLDPETFETEVKKSGKSSRRLLNDYLPPNILKHAGNDVTEDKIGDIEFGEFYDNSENTDNDVNFIDPKRIESLRESNKSTEYDLTRLIRYCEEINENFKMENYLSVAMLGRSIINHIPPIFGYSTFKEVSNNYGSKSFKDAMKHLNETKRSIADKYLHEKIRKKESLPNVNQVNFSQDMDVLLEEIIRRLEV